MSQNDVVITGIGLVSSLGEGPDAHWLKLTAEPQPVVDEARFPPYAVHPLPPIEWGLQIAKRGDQRQMETWQRLGTYAAGLALADAGIAGNLDILGRTHAVIAADGGERDVPTDSAILRDGLVQLLVDRGHTVTAAVGDGDLLRAAVTEDAPDACVIDIRMPPTFTDEGLRAALVIRNRWPDVAVLVFSQYVEERYAAELLEGGTSGIGYLLKDRVADVREFVVAVRRVASGGTVLDPEVVAQLVTRRRRDERLSSLTQREHEVLALMAEGRTNNAIADALFVSEGTVEKHIRSIFMKLGLEDTESVHRRVLAVLTYLRLGEEDHLSPAY